MRLTTRNSARARAGRFAGGLHPLLLAAYPVLLLFAENLEQQVTMQAVAGSLVAVVASTAVVLGVLTILLRDLLRAGLITTLLVALVFSYGYAWDALADRLGSDRFLLIAWALLLYFGIALAFRARRRAAAITTALNMGTAALVILNLIPIAAHELGSATQVGAPRDRTESEATAIGGRRPDIYYLIFDRYAGAETLAEHYGFDNSDFLAELERRGFYVAAESRANYLMTAHSMASSLNMEYLDPTELTAEARSTGDLRPLYQMIGAGYEVEEFLHSRGYTYIHVGTWWEGAPNSAADQYFRYGRLSAFSTALYETTVLAAIAPLVLPEDADPRQIYRQHTLYQFDILNRISGAPGPKFVFAHFSLPHDPYVFDRHGNYVSEAEVASRSVEESYTEQVRYANKRIVELLDALLAGPRSSHPLIVLQADEGPRPHRFAADFRGFQWSTATRAELLHKLRILNAFYLPEARDSELYSSITPVNSFRALFNHYFDAQLPLLPDRSYIFRDVEHPYEFTDVTAELEAVEE